MTPKHSTSRRQRPISCYFCRTRKLRCSRNQPCFNCSSRQLPCRFDDSTVEPLPASRSRRINTHADLLDRIRRLEETVARHSTQGLVDKAASTAPSVSSLTPSLSVARQLVPLASQAPSEPQSERSPRSLAVSDDVAWLEQVSNGQTPYTSIHPNPTPFFKIVGIRSISDALSNDSWSDLSTEAENCIWLPRYEETKILLNRYISTIGFIYHVVHTPSLLSVIDEIYLRMQDQRNIQLDQMALLLSILSSATYAWTDPQTPHSGERLFDSAAEAHAQTQYWVKATFTVLNAAQELSFLSVELIQGVIILAFVICNKEGISLRHRSLISTGLLLSRELRLHRCDHPANAAKADTLQAEIGRRVWWYLVATDWIMAARYSASLEGSYQAHPSHMAVKKPRNINDEDLSDGAIIVEQPLSQPTDMSYFLQRLRLAEVCRSIIDRSPLATATSTVPSYDDIIAIDAEFDKFIKEIPPFLSMDNDNPTEVEQAQPPSLVVQAYMLNNLAHTQRCRLHLPYLTSSLTNSTFAYSRQACVDAVRRLIHIEKRLRRESHPFVLTRLRFDGLFLYGVFIAGVILLMDACMDGPASQSELRESEVVEAFRILDDARGQSPAANKLFESLLHIFRKYKVAPPLSRAFFQDIVPGHVDQGLSGPGAITHGRALNDDQLSFSKTCIEGVGVSASVESVDSSSQGNQKSPEGVNMLISELGQMLEGWMDVDMLV